MRTAWGLILFTFVWGTFCLLVFFASILHLENPFRNVYRVLRILAGDKND
jgi:hypothetical protein